MDGRFKEGIIGIDLNDFEVSMFVYDGQSGRRSNDRYEFTIYEFIDKNSGDSYNGDKTYGNE